MSLCATLWPLQVDDDSNSFLDLTFSLLQDFVANGNVPAHFRLEEFERLHEMLQLIKDRPGACAEIAINGQAHKSDKLLDGRILLHTTSTAFDSGEQRASPSNVLSMISLFDDYHTLTDASTEQEPYDWVWQT